MSSPTAADQTRARRTVSLPAPGRPAADRSAATPMTLAWGVSRRALGDRAPRGSAQLVRLELTIDAHARSAWILRDPRSNHTATLDLAADTPTECATAGDCLLIRGPHIYALVRTTAGVPELLYARAPVFEALDIPGGRYQVIGVEFR